MSCLFRFLTYCYLLAFNAWLLLAPIVLCYDWQVNGININTAISTFDGMFDDCLSCDWQVGSIPLVESLWDGRNIASLALALVMLALSLNCVTCLQVSAHTGTASPQTRSVIIYEKHTPKCSFLVLIDIKAFTRAVSHPAVLYRSPLSTQFFATHRHGNRWKIAANV